MPNSRRDQLLKRPLKSKKRTRSLGQIYDDDDGDDDDGHRIVAADDRDDDEEAEGAGDDGDRG